MTSSLFSEGPAQEHRRSTADCGSNGGGKDAGVLDRRSAESSDAGPHRWRYLSVLWEFRDDRLPQSSSGKVSRSTVPQ